MDSLKVVLDEQLAQWDDGMEDEEGLAELYMARAKHARMVALTRGLKIEREAQEIHAQMLVESPFFYSSLAGLKQQSLYIERVLLLSRSKSSSATATSATATTSPLRQRSSKTRSRHTSPSRKQKVKRTSSSTSESRLTSPIRKPKILPHPEVKNVPESPSKSGRRAPKLHQRQSSSTKSKMNRRVEIQ